MDIVAIPMLINSDFMEIPLDKRLDLADYKLYGEKSHVFQNKDRLHSLYETTGLTMNDLTINGETLEYFIKKNKTGIALASVYGIENVQTLVTLTAMQAVANSSAAMQAVANSSAAMQAVANSSTAMQAVINSSTAMQAVANSSAAMQAVINSSTAMQAVINSSTAMQAVANSSAAMQAVLNSSTAMQAVINSSTAMQAVANSSAAMQAVANSSTAMQAVLNSSTAMQAVIKVGKKVYYGDRGNASQLDTKGYTLLSSFEAINSQNGQVFILTGRMDDNDSRYMTIVDVLNRAYNVFGTGTVAGDSQWDYFDKGLYAFKLPIQVMNRGGSAHGICGVIA